MNQDRVMLLIDADNVSVDVMEQAVRLLLNQHGALHVRRAYCTAESAVKHQTAFKRLGIKPMVNLAAGKNSTDIAMAIDAIDLAIAERPQVVVIASSDSDFAPLVLRLREKGCVVRGIGQRGKTGDETQDVYDDYTVLEHHKNPGSDSAAARPARKAPARKAASAPAKTPQAAQRAVFEPVTEAAVPAAPAATPARSAPARSAPARSAPARSAPPAPAARKATATRKPATKGAAPVASISDVLACLPELAAGQSLALNAAVQRLREVHLLGKNASSLKLFAQWSDRFELLPEGKPTQVRLRR